MVGAVWVGFWGVAEEETTGRCGWGGASVGRRVLGWYWVKVRGLRGCGWRW